MSGILDHETGRDWGESSRNLWDCKTCHEQNSIMLDSHAKWSSNLHNWHKWWGTISVCEHNHIKLVARSVEIGFPFHTKWEWNLIKWECIAVLTFLKFLLPKTETMSPKCDMVNWVQVITWQSLQNPKQSWVSGSEKNLSTKKVLKESTQIHALFLYHPVKTTCSF